MTTGHQWQWMLVEGCDWERVEGEGSVDKFWVRYKNSLQKMKE